MDRLNAIEIFIRAVDTGSFSATARHFNIGHHKTRPLALRITRICIEHKGTPVAFP